MRCIGPSGEFWNGLVLKVKRAIFYEGIFPWELEQKSPWNLAPGITTAITARITRGNYKDFERNKPVSRLGKMLGDWGVVG